VDGKSRQPKKKGKGKKAKVGQYKAGRKRRNKTTSILTGSKLLRFREKRDVGGLRYKSLDFNPRGEGGKRGGRA